MHRAAAQSHRHKLQRVLLALLIYFDLHILNMLCLEKINLKVIIFYSEPNTLSITSYPSEINTHTHINDSV